MLMKRKNRGLKKLKRFFKTIERKYNQYMNEMLSDSTAIREAEHLDRESIYLKRAEEQEVLMKQQINEMYLKGASYSDIAIKFRMPKYEVDRYITKESKQLRKSMRA